MHRAGRLVTAASGDGEALPALSAHRDAEALQQVLFEGAPVHADADALDAHAVRPGRRVEADQHRLVEQVRVAVELADLEHHVGLRHVDEVADVEQQEVALADAGVERKKSITNSTLR